MKPQDLGLFSCFTTLALHLEPPGRRSPPPSLGRLRVPTGTPTPGHAHLREQLSLSLGEAGQGGGGRDEVFGEKACGQDEKLVNFPVSKTGGIWESECDSVISDKSVCAGETGCGVSLH